MALNSALQGTTKQYEGSILGRKIAVEYTQPVIAYAVLALRFIMGWTFLQAGLDKLTADNWTAEGFLKFAIPEGNPFTSLWAEMAGNSLIDTLNMWGLTLVGIALILGVFVRWSAFWGAVIMLFYWMASLQGGLLDGLPLEHGYVVDDHIVYLVLLFGIGALGAGRIVGLDAIIEKWEIVRQNSWLRYLLG